MKKFLYIAAAAIAALSACTKAEIEAPETETAKAPVFTATIEGDAETKTTLANGTKVNWENGDEVFMYFANAAGIGKGEGTALTCFTVYQATPSVSDAREAALSMKDGEGCPPAATVPFECIFPASMIDKNTLIMAFPATQVYKGDDKIGFAPMFYINTPLISGDETVPPYLSFINVSSLLKVTVPYSQMQSVRSITVSSNLKMNGANAQITNDGLGWLTPSVYETGENQITLDCYSFNSSNVNIPTDGSKTFYVSIPPQAYDYLQIDVTDGTNTKTMKTKAAEITVERNKIYPIAFADNQTPAHAYVDLGLSVKWATMNVGATTPEGYGDYFAWGATEPLYEAGYAQESPQAHWKTGKSAGYCFNNTPYQTANTTSDSSTKWTKYLGSTSSGFKNSSASNADALKTVLDMEDDAARANWGGNWRMPTREEWAELINSSNCKWTWTTQEGIKGYKVQSKKTGYTDNWIFLPAAGWRTSTNLDYLGTWCYYWSSSILTSNPYGAGALKGNEDVDQATNYPRRHGLSIRPVCE